MSPQKENEGRSFNAAPSSNLMRLKISLNTAEHLKHVAEEHRLVEKSNDKCLVTELFPTELLLDNLKNALLTSPPDVITTFLGDLLDLFLFCSTSSKSPENIAALWHHIHPLLLCLQLNCLFYIPILFKCPVN